MIFFADNDGTIISSFPSPVYQGSANANDIYLIAPFATNLQVTVAFKLPNGVWTERYLMTPMTEIAGVINERTGKPYAGWRFALPNEITQYYGTVTAQFFFYAGRDVVLTASSATSFTVGYGVPSVLPSSPDVDVYEQIIDNISYLSQQVNNGTFAARSIYAWRASESYGANEIVFYPDKGEYGVLVKSLVEKNDAAPYEDGNINGECWSEVTDFNILNDLYSIKADAELSAKAAAESATEAAQTASAAAEQTAAADETVARSLAQVQKLSADAEASAEAAEQWAELARSFAEFGIKINTDYASVSELPQQGSAQYIYLIPNGSEGNNSYDEYIWIDKKQAYEKIGTTEIDLTDYATKTALATAAETEATAREEADNLKADKNGSYPDMSVGSLTTARLIDGVPFDGSQDITHYGTCITSASTAAKIADIPGLEILAAAGIALDVGIKICIKFTYANTASSPTLDVNGTGAKAIKADGDTTYVKWLAGAVMEFVYDGTYWVCTGGYQLQGMRVGYVYLSNTGTSPATLYGGTWASINSGYYLKAITSGTPTYGSAGLPNISGEFTTYIGWESGNTTGALQITKASYGNNHYEGAGDTNVYDTLKFDASSSDSIYGNSTTVTPQNYGVYMWYRTA